MQKNRSLLLGRLYKDLFDYKARPPSPPSFLPFKSSLLTTLEEFSKVENIKKELDDLASKYKLKLKEYQEALDKVLARISEWRWNDPISLLYNELFTSDVVFDPTFNEEEIKSELAKRQLHKIPPGYLDAGKEDLGVGDLLIWHTILEVGKKWKKNVIFVSGDVKEDWWQKSEGNQFPLYPRFELVDEFRRFTGGYSFQIIQFNQFLRLYKVDEKFIENVETEELLFSKQPLDLTGPITPRISSQIKLSVLTWLKTQYKSNNFEIIPGSIQEKLDFIIEQTIEMGPDPEDNQTVDTGVVILVSPNPKDLLFGGPDLAYIPANTFAFEAICVCRNETEAIYLGQSVESLIIGMSSWITLDFGYIDRKGEFLLVGIITSKNKGGSPSFRRVN